MRALTTQQLLQKEGWQQQVQSCCGDSLKCVCIQYVAAAQQSGGSYSCQLAHSPAACLLAWPHKVVGWAAALLQVGGMPVWPHHRV